MIRTFTPEEDHHRPLSANPIMPDLNIMYFIHLEYGEQVEGSMNQSLRKGIPNTHALQL